MQNMRVWCTEYVLIEVANVFRLKINTFATSFQPYSVNYTQKILQIHKIR